MSFRLVLALSKSIMCASQGLYFLCHSFEWGIERLTGLFAQEDELEFLECGMRKPTRHMVRCEYSQ
jgi:hypothetical protein